MSTAQAGATNPAKAPNPLDFDLGDLRAIGPDLLDHLDAVRDATPIFWSDIQQGWFVCRYDDVVAGFMNKLPLSNERLDRLAFAAIPESEWATRIPLLTSGTPTFANMTDPPYHGRLRKPMNLAFGAKNIERIRPFVKRRIVELLDAAEEMAEFEFIEHMARPLTGSVIMALMGMPEEVLGNLREWANGIVNALGTPRPSAQLLEDGEAAMRAMDALFTAELEKRKANPTDDFMSVMAAASQGENALTHAEVLGTCVNTLLAGHESTASTMAFGTAALAQHPDQVRYLLDHPQGIADAVAEVGRFVAMSASQTRVATETFEWHGSRIDAGDVVYLWVAAAGRDPKVIANPKAFDVSRGSGESLVFGRGIHFCVGHLLAKLQLGEFFPACFARFNVDILDDPLDFSGGYAFRTLSTMNVRFTPR